MVSVAKPETPIPFPAPRTMVVTRTAPLAKRCRRLFLARRARGFSAAGDRAPAPFAAADGRRKSGRNTRLTNATPFGMFRRSGSPEQG